MWVALAALAGVLAVSACGGGTDIDESASKTAITPEAQEQAESMILQLSDFPNGWRGSAPEDDENDEAFRKCIGVDYSSLTRTGAAESRDFAMGESTEASSSAAVFANEQQAEDFLEEFSAGMNGNKVEGCLQELVDENAEGDNTFKVGEVDVGEFNVTPPNVEDAAAWQLVVPVEITSGVGEGLTPSLYLEDVILRQGDKVATIETSDVLTEFDPDLRDKLIQTVAGRMSDASG